MGPDSGVGALVFLVFSLFAILAIVVAISLAGLWFTFEKADESGWKSIVPIYNVAIIAKLGGNSGLWGFTALLLPLPYLIAEFINVAGPGISLIDIASTLSVVSFVVLILLIRDMAKRFDKGVGFTVGLIFLPAIFWLIIGLDSSKYQSTSKQADNYQRE